jgi:hypothetical protein
MINKPGIGSSSLLGIAFLIPLLLASCAAAPQRMTEAALVGDSAALDDLLRSGAGNVNQAYIFGKNPAACPGETVLTPLQAATCAGHASVVKKLLDNKANPDLATRAGRKTPLFLALDNGREDIVRLLVESGANLDVGDAGGNTALMVAAKKGNGSLAEFLLKRGASTRLVNRDGETALMQASDLIMAKMLVNLGADPFQKSAGGESPLQVATRKGNAGAAGYFRELEEKSRKEIEQEMAAGDLAAKTGRFDEASSRYSAAIAKASGLGGPAAMDARVRVLKTVNGLPDPPGLSGKAREHLVRSSYILKNSQNLDQAEKEVAAAINADPWWLDGYYNIGILQAKLNRFAVAEENLAIYIAAAPPGPKAQGAQDKIYEIRLAREEADKISGVTGQWKDGSGASYGVAIDGGNLRIQSPGGLTFALTLNNNVIKGSVEGGSSSGPHGCTFPGQIHPVNGKLDPDANGMSLEYLWSRYDTKFHYVNMFGAPVAGNCLTCETRCDAVNIIATNTVNLRLVRSGGAPKSGGPGGARPSVERTIADPSMRNFRRGN